MHTSIGVKRATGALVGFALCSAMAYGDLLAYTEIKLTSDISGLAPNLDSNLKNPWGMSFGLATPFWVSDQVTGVSTLYSAAGVPNALVVTIPPSPGGGPTGQVFVGGQGFTMKGGGNPPNFAFVTLDGNIDAWNGGTTAQIQNTIPGAVFTGLAIAGSRLYAADTAGNKIDVFDNNFDSTTVSGSFLDPSVPSGFTPYNIQNVGGKLYVEYASQSSPGGYIGVFDTNGNFLQHISDPHLDSPWGITLAPPGFGKFGGDLLVGNEDEGVINAFNPITGAFLGTISDANGNPLVNTGLWALNFRAPGSGIDPNTLFFVAGINDEKDGLFGAIVPTPEPSSVALVGFLLVAVVLFSRTKNARRDGTQLP